MAQARCERLSTPGSAASTWNKTEGPERSWLWCRPAPAAPDGDYDAEEGLTFETSKGVRVVTSFDDMRLKDLLMRGIYQFGFEKPSAIQQRAIIPISEGRDVIAQAQSGTGKTSMIAVAMCQRVDTSTRECVLHRTQAPALRYVCSLPCLPSPHCSRCHAALESPASLSACLGTLLNTGFLCWQGAGAHPVAHAGAGCADHEDHPGRGRLCQDQRAHVHRRHQPGCARFQPAAC